MPAHDQQFSDSPVLARDEAARRLRLLGELQSALSGLGVRSVLARRRLLVLRWPAGGPSGLTDPQLHILASDATSIAIATTDGTAFLLSDGQGCPVIDQAVAAAFAVGVPLVSRL